MFGERFAQRGITLRCPDFNEPDFATLTITRMLDQLDAAIGALPAEPVALMGSSLGAFVAWHAAARRGRREGTAAARTHPISHLVLMAPALEFGANRMRELGDEGIARWKATGQLEVFHYGYGEPRTVGYALYEDAAHYDSNHVQVTAPSVVFQGEHDALVDPRMVERFVAARPSMSLHMLDDDHQLLASVDYIWNETVAFLGL
jgi:pimeloyl-ACP methyl ester carboxylesterase